MASTKSNQTYAGMIAIIGRPNVGKSTLLNLILGDKVAAVSHRPHTTRNRILGVKTVEKKQLVLIDTPGIHRGEAGLGHYLNKEALAALDGVDGILLVIEAPKTDKKFTMTEDDKLVLERLKQHQIDLPIVIAINKIDLQKDLSTLLPHLAALQSSGYERIVPLSALKNNGVDRLEKELLSLLPPGPHLYPEDMITDRAERFLVAEMIREQVYLACRQEVPYSVAVEVTQFQERTKPRQVFIEAVVHVERESQKAIVIGAKGAMIKRIGTAAREQIGTFLAMPAHLNLTIHVATEWTKTPATRRRFGYE